jgi:eukaryotic-like serine/threonine-protein kinase
VIAHRLSSSKVLADRKIGKYIITERIANGGSGLIFKGNHVLLNMPVAIKMLKHELAMKLSLKNSRLYSPDLFRS